MTEKQISIIKVALELFAQQGYLGTSTSSIAKKAGVSEGLIFRHFENKEGLLKAILEQGKELAHEEYVNVLSLTDPKDMIRGILEIPFHVKEDQYHFWKLIYALKWQMDIYDASFSEPIRLALIDAFSRLKAEDPEAEAALAMAIIDGMAMAVLLRKPDNLEAMKAVTLARYSDENLLKM